jgi:hypothetical protein
MPIFNITFSRHARQQAKIRDSMADLSLVQRYAAEIAQHEDALEVRVVIRKHEYYALPDGSNGDLTIACVDPRSGIVKTVMLQRSSQSTRKNSRETPYI